MNPEPQTEILVIDDETSIRKILEITLQSNGYAILQAATAREGLQMAADNTWESIVESLNSHVMEALLSSSEAYQLLAAEAVAHHSSMTVSGALGNSNAAVVIQAGTA